MTGGTVNVWCGAGDGTVHSSPFAPSHARAAAFDLPGLRDPRPPEDAAEAQSPGLY